MAVYGICAYLMVSRKVFLSFISSGMRLRITLRATDLRLSSWKGSSVRVKRYSLTMEGGRSLASKGKLLAWLLTIRFRNVALQSEYGLV